MATNLVQEPGYQLSVVVTNPAAPDSGDPVRFGSLTGMALVDEGDGGNAATETTVNFGPFVANFTVDDTSGSGIAVGAAVFYDDTATGTPAVNLNDDSANGYFFGFALEAVGNNATTEIMVYHTPSPGAGSLGAGTVGTSQLADNAVTAGKLTATMGTGFIPLDITSLREIASNAIQNLAAHGGILASDSAPQLERVNGATDKALRVTWTAEADTDEAQFPPVPLPVDLDATENVTFHCLAAMEDTNDTPTIDVQVWDAVGDTEMGGATGAVTGTSVAEYTVTILAANISGPPTGFLNIGLVPAAHATDDMYLYAAWLEYARV
jgi:predicted RecA/RadA family phage recombinase